MRFLSKSCPKSKPTICYLAHQLDPGGTEKLVYQMALALKKNYEIIVCTLEDIGLYGQALRKAGIPVYPLFREPGVDLNIVFSLLRIFFKHEVSLLHAHQYSPYFYAVLAKFFYPQVKIIFQEHGRHYPEIDKPLRKLVNRFFFQPLTAAIVAVSHEVKERLIRYEGLSKKRIRVIYNGIEDVILLSPEEKRELRRKWGFSDTQVVAATVGRFDPIKNLPLFLKALALARTQIPALRGLLIGDGPEMPALKGLCHKLGLKEAVIFTGYREDAVKLLQMADIFVLSSLSEGTSLALLEAMACGLPLIATAVGGNPEIIADGKSGLLVPNQNLPALAAALLILAQDPVLRQRMGQKARQIFEKKFTFQKMLASYQDLYQEILPNKTRARKVCVV